MNAIQEILPFNRHAAGRAGKRQGGHDRHEISQEKAGPAVIALVSDTQRSLALAQPLAEALAQRHGLRIVSDRPEVWQTCGLPVQALAESSPRRVLARCRQHQNKRLLVDLAAARSSEEFAGLLLPCQEIVWVVEPETCRASIQRLQAVLHAAPEWAGRLHLVWLRHGVAAIPGVHSDLGLHKPAWRLHVDESTSRVGSVDVERLVHSLLHTRLGLALGGGGARGAAHVGILRALEKAGIAVDLMAGASMGAFVGLSYAFGYTPDEILDLIGGEMAAPRACRALPGGGLGHMAWMYRSGGWRRKAQRFFPDCTFEQLALPLFVVAADLVTGQEIVHDRGDAIAALLESINFPGMARPILRDGKVVVDGGVLNNVPTSVVRARGADVVVAADVAWKIAPRFGRCDPSLPADQWRHPSAVETLLRVIQVQQRALINARADAADLTITPDVMCFGFTDYHRAREIADAGEAAAEQALPALKKLLAEAGRPVLPTGAAPQSTAVCS